MAERDPMREAIATIVREIVDERSAIAPGTKLSQKTSEQLRGIPSRVYLEHTRHPALAPSVLRVGKLRLVDAALYDRFLATLDEESRAHRDAPEPDDADVVLRELGFARTGTR